MDGYNTVDTAVGEVGHEIIKKTKNITGSFYLTDCTFVRRIRCLMSHDTCIGYITYHMHTHCSLIGRQ